MFLSRAFEFHPGHILLINIIGASASTLSW